MSNSVYPVLAGLSWSVVKTPQFNTKIQKSVSGVELRASFMSSPVYTFGLTYEVLRAGGGFSELQTLMGFFNQRLGSFDNFLFDDLTDNSVTAQNIGTGTGSLTTFQLTRTFGGFTESVMNVNAAPQIFVNGVLKTLTTDYTISATGLVTFVTAPANGLAVTWTGTYYYRCRFVEDTTDYENFMYQLWALKSVELISSLGNKI